ncbi:MAG: type II toxin-antitoxin system VapC family toxin [Deltaproteobacteria bacterium]|nr:type II toxin-antitoxin system VapC family toxin [Deltaproteobacteria bacterium]
MRILLDTHVWLWMLSDPGKLRDSAREVLEARESELHLSAASAWEIAIKYRLGKLPLPEEPALFVPKRLERDGVRPLPISHAHALAEAGLPPHHRDPFDRLLVAQARVEGLVLCTVDPMIGRYDVETLRA